MNNGLADPLYVRICRWPTIWISAVTDWSRSRHRILRTTFGVWDKSRYCYADLRGAYCRTVQTYYPNEQDCNHFLEHDFLFIQISLWSDCVHYQLRIRNWKSGTEQTRVIGAVFIESRVVITVFVITTHVNFRQSSVVTKSRGKERKDWISIGS